MIIPKKDDIVYIWTTEGTQIQAQVIEWGTSFLGINWVVVKDDSKAYNINMEHISVFSILSTTDERYKIVDSEGNEKVIESNLPIGYNIIKKGEDGVKTSQGVSITRRILKQGKAVLEEGIGESSKLSLDPVERIRQQAQQQQSRIQSTRQSVKDHLARKDLIKPKEVYALPSIKDSPKK